MMTQTLDRYEEKLMGLPYPVVLLDAAEEVTHPKTGKVLRITIPEAEEMAAAVALALCFIPTRLTGAEVRFIRRVLDMTGKDFASAVEMDRATLSRWEHGKQEVGAWADKAVRMAAVLQLQDRAPGSSLRPEDVVTLHFAPRDPELHPQIEVRRTPRSTQSRTASPVQGWDARLAA